MDDVRRYYDRTKQMPTNHGVTQYQSKQLNKAREAGVLIGIRIGEKNYLLNFGIAKEHFSPNNLVTHHERTTRS